MGAHNPKVVGSNPAPLPKNIQVRGSWSFGPVSLWACLWVAGATARLAVDTCSVDQSDPLIHEFTSLEHVGDALPQELQRRAGRGHGRNPMSVLPVS